MTTRERATDHRQADAEERKTLLERTGNQGETKRRRDRHDTTQSCVVLNVSLNTRLHLRTRGLFTTNPFKGRWFALFENLSQPAAAGV
jgi:hypothetical protein